MHDKTHETISIIIPCYNAQRWIRETLSSVLAQNIASMEIIVVDDGSTDDSARIIQQEFPAVRLLQTENRGPSHARNVGTQASSGTLIQYLDADDLLVPDKLNAQAHLLEETGADVAYGDWQFLVPTSNGSFVPGQTVHRQITGEPEIELFTTFWCPPAAYLFRRSIVEKVGGWNERLPVIQDARFALDCALQGGRFAYCPRLVAQYRNHRVGSVSTQNGVAFVRDVFQNAVEIHEGWQRQGGISEQRRTALHSVYSYIAQSTVRNDKATFEAAYGALKALSPNGMFIPKGSPLMRITTHLIGYPRAESIAALLRQLETLLRSTVRHYIIPSVHDSSLL